MRSKFKLGVQSGSPQQSWCRCAVHFFLFMIVHSRVIVTYTALHTYPPTYLQWTVCQEKCLMRASFIDFFLNWLINLCCRIEVFQCSCTTGRGVEPSSSMLVYLAKRLFYLLIYVCLCFGKLHDGNFLNPDSCYSSMNAFCSCYLQLFPVPIGRRSTW